MLQQKKDTCFQVLLLNKERTKQTPFRKAKRVVSEATATVTAGNSRTVSSESGVWDALLCCSSWLCQ